MAVKKVHPIIEKVPPFLRKKHMQCRKFLGAGESGIPAEKMT